MAVEWPVKQLGDQDQAVRSLQHLLNFHGATLEPDGVFGEATQAAVKEFQTAHALPEDGVVDASTWQALVTDVGNGDAGEAVKAAQVQLYVRGTLPTVDGVFGVRTDISVRRFQVFRGLEGTGIVNTDTWRTLLATEYVPMAGGDAGVALEGENDWRTRLLAKIRPTGPNFGQ
ncbi:MAG TPA: peptidoglycan-binding protein [Actinomycetota bacterium]|jgi:peptidoglycan hydrolase-like protein with peptidoglycan-binding domain|nr:peptidoglycan-binding protein [Actinomycetota bacterium]